MSAADFPLPEKRAVRRSFEHAAAGYDAAAVLQREVCNRVLERLDYIRIAPRRIIDIGCGTGYAAQRLLERYPRTQLCGIDIAAAMLHIARKRTDTAGMLARLLGARSRFTALCADAEAVPLAAHACALAFSNLSLQWCDPRQFFAEVSRILEPGGLFMFTTFGPDTLKELREAFAELDGSTHVNGFLDMHDIGDLLVSAGFADPVMDMEIVTLTYSDLAALVSELKSIGAHNVMPGRRSGLMGRDAWHRLVIEYERHRRDGRLPATFEVVYGHAWKPLHAPAKRGNGSQVIHFERGASR